MAGRLDRQGSSSPDTLIAALRRAGRQTGIPAVSRSQYLYNLGGVAPSHRARRKRALCGRRAPRLQCYIQDTRHSPSLPRSFPWRMTARHVPST
jgi:hypothetical protein